MFLVVPLLVWTLDDPDKNALRMENGMRTVDIGRIQRFVANAGNEVFTSARKLEEAAKQSGLSKEEIEVLLAAYRKGVEVEQPSQIEKETAGKIKEKKTAVKSENNYCTLVDAYMESKRYQEAEKTALEGLKHSKDPSTVYALYFRLGAIYFITDQMDKQNLFLKK
jgi:hypothetical protein